MSKQRLLAIVLLVVFHVCCSATSSDKKDRQYHTEIQKQMNSTKIRIKINSQSFMATLLDNNTTAAFRKMLPLTISMSDLNGDEKYGELSYSLPTNASNPGTIQKGDLMLFGSKTLVLFYKTRSTSYSYTKLGTVDDVTGLARALEAENVEVTME